jgi:hypothetical protein
MQAVPEKIPFFAYLVCDLTEDVTRMALDWDLQRTSDGGGFFGYYHNNHGTNRTRSNRDIKPIPIKYWFDGSSPFTGLFFQVQDALLRKKFGVVINVRIITT